MDVFYIICPFMYQCNYVISTSSSLVHRAMPNRAGESVCIVPL
jgi:hypothetical protein